MSAYDEALEDVHNLLDPPSVKYEYWENEVANRKLFYVRGFTWFRREICRNITELNRVEYVEEMYSLLKGRATWLSQPYPWDEVYGWKQAYHASQGYNRTGGIVEPGEYVNGKSKKPSCVLKFHKAAQTILFCEAVARLRHKNGEDVYERMRIQPACAYIHGFTATLLDELSAIDRQFLSKLRAATGQKDVKVFEDMAKYRFPVTYHLAFRVHKFISDNYNTRIGLVDVRLDGKNQLSPSVNENIEVDYADPQLIPTPERGAA